MSRSVLGSHLREGKVSPFCTVRSASGSHRHAYGGVARLLGPAALSCQTVTDRSVGVSAVCPAAREPIERRYKPTHRNSSARLPAVTVQATSPETTLPTVVCPAVREPTSPRVNPETDRTQSL
jgi:hypothetical protein